MVSTVRFLFRNAYLNKYVILSNLEHETKYVYQSPFNYGNFFNGFDIN